MELISIVISNKKSKIILARQFIIITKMELENHIIEFTRNLYNSSTDPESTIVETDKFRYLYHKFNSLFLVVITNKNSNIIEVSKVIRLVTMLIQDLCKSTKLEDKAGN